MQKEAASELYSSPSLLAFIKGNGLQSVRSAFMEIIIIPVEEDFKAGKLWRGVIHGGRPCGHSRRGAAPAATGLASWFILFPINQL